jgi:hypothetical protein
MMLPGSDALFGFSVQGVPEGIVFPHGPEGHSEDKKCILRAATTE